MDRVFKGTMAAFRLLLFVAIAMAAKEGFAQTETAAGGQFSPLTERQDRRASPDQRKIDPFLRSTLSSLARRGMTRTNALAQNATALSNAFVKVDQGGRIQAYFQLSSLGSLQLSELRRLEVEIEVADDERAIVQGWAPFDRIEAIAGLGFVERVTRPGYGTRRSGSVNSQGDAIHLADQLRALGIDGSGVKVGVISTGTFGLASSQATGDTPSSVTQFGSCNVAAWGTVGCAEGTAMLEIVHDLAPGAALAFGPASTDLEFNQRVDQLADTFGADVVVDDLGFFGQPFFEDGSIAQKVQSKTGQLVYVSSAGNSAQDHYEAQFVPRNVTIAGTAMVAHDFGGGDVGLNFTVAGGGSFTVLMQWADPFGASGNNYDLLFFNSSLTGPLCAGCQSTDIQDGNDDPFEAFGLINNGAGSASGTLVIRRVSGAARPLEIYILGSGVTFLQYQTTAGSIFGHPAAAGAVGVAAIAASDPGNNTIEPFSSRGPSDIYFPSFESRPKPDIAGIDGVSITGAGGFPNPFFGTSAAAPHVAALAALLRQVAPTASPADLVAALKTGAVDLGPAGFDSTFGAGRADVVAAAAALGFPFDRNDLIVSFPPGDRLWARLNNTIWRVLHGLSPDIVATGRMDSDLQDEVIASFGPSLGLWVYRNNTAWEPLHGAEAQAVVTGNLDLGSQAEVIVDFGAALGLWARFNDSSWVKLHGSSPRALATADMDNNGQDELIADFGALGLWIWRNNSAWQKLHGASPLFMTGADLDNDGRDEVVVNFGPTIGLWARFNDSSWVKLNGLSPGVMTAADMDGNGIDELVADFGSSLGGLWVWRNNTAWQRLHGTSPEDLATADLDKSGQEEVVVDYGLPLGLWARFNDSSWVKLNRLSPQAMESGDIDGN